MNVKWFLLQNNRKKCRYDFLAFTWQNVLPMQSLKEGQISLVQSKDLPRIGTIMHLSVVTPALEALGNRQTPAGTFQKMVPCYPGLFPGVWPGTSWLARWLPGGSKNGMPHCGTRAGTPYHTDIWNNHNNVKGIYSCCKKYQMPDGQGCSWFTWHFQEILHSPWDFPKFCWSLSTEFLKLKGKSSLSGVHQGRVYNW